ncbi:MAG: helix-turn-helix transcriptional regulator [Armatimonadetes bacterium]|nr:helix-turn-helix transcriptional regulator [Armatimonadota bacterium]
MNPELARRFQELVKQEGSQFAVAHKIGCTQSYVGQIARGQARPSREIIERTIDVFQLPREEWLALAGYGPARSPEDERVEIARMAVEEALRRLGHAGPDPASGHDVFWQEYGNWVEECRERSLPAPATPRLSGGTRSLTPEEARRQIAVLKRVYQEELERNRSR